MNVDDDDPLLSLGDLLLRSTVRVGVLATAIEQHGIYSWDRYGRFKHFGPGSIEAGAALDVLAKYFDALCDADETRWFDESSFRDGGADHYCWPSSKLPNLDAADASLEVASPRMRTGPEKRSDSGLLHMIGALLLTMDGKAGQPRHPAFSSEAKLMDFLSDHFKGYDGMSLRNLKDKASKAKHLFDV